MADTSRLRELSGFDCSRNDAGRRGRSTALRPSWGSKAVTPEETTVVAGIPIPSTSPVFLTVVGLHVVLGLVCVVAGAIAMLSPKRSGRHPSFGTIYYWSLAAVFVSATALS